MSSRTRNFVITPIIMLIIATAIGYITVVGCKNKEDSFAYKFIETARTNKVYADED